MTSKNFFPGTQRLEMLVPKNHFVREVVPFPRSGHICRCKAGTTTEVTMIAAKARRGGEPHGYGL